MRSSLNENAGNARIIAPVSLRIFAACRGGGRLECSPSCRAMSLPSSGPTLRNGVLLTEGDLRRAYAWCWQCFILAVRNGAVIDYRYLSRDTVFRSHIRHVNIGEKTWVLSLSWILVLITFAHPKWSTHFYGRGVPYLTSGEFYPSPRNCVVFGKQKVRPDPR